MAKANIMIVEDDAITAMDIENQVKNLGYGVTAIVSYGEKAIEKVKENTPDLVLMDIVLKGEMDGIEAAEEIHTQFDIPVVFLTAFADKDRLKRAKLTNPFGFILKPFQDKDLEVTIEMALYVDKVDTERKQAEDMLRDSKRLLNDVFNSIQDGISILDTDLTILNVNDVMNKWYLQNLPLEGKKCHLSYHNSNEPCDPCPTIRCIESGQTEWDIVPGLPGSPVEWVELFSYPMKDQLTGEVTGVAEFVRDITERKRAEEALRESEDKHRTLLENIPQKIFFKDTDSIYVSCNENYAKDLKINSEEITGKTDYDFYPKELAEKYRGDDKRIIQSGETEEIEEEYIQNGKIFIVQTVKTPVRDEIGNVKGILGIFWDVTDRKQGKE